MGKTNWKVPLIIVIGIIAVVLAIIFGVSSIYNRFDELADMYEKLCEVRSANE